MFSDKAKACGDESTWKDAYQFQWWMVVVWWSLGGLISIVLYFIGLIKWADDKYANEEEACALFWWQAVLYIIPAVLLGFYAHYLSINNDLKSLTEQCCAYTCNEDYGTCG